MDENNNDRPPEGHGIITPDGLMVGILLDDWEASVRGMTDGRYDRPGEFATIAIVPRIVDGSRSGLLLGFTFFGPDGKVDRIEVGAISYASWIAATAAIVRCLRDAGLLKHEAGGAMIESLMKTLEPTPEPTTQH